MAKVKVAQGWLEGELLELVTGDGQYYSFKGIPYAAPPVGKLRFKAPQPPLPWDGVKKASTHGSECTQKDIFTGEITLGSEDCLFLNVYTCSLTPETPLPVMVYIHGGGYQCGSGDEKNYGPDFLVKHGVLLVTINYRVGALGFLCLDTEDVPGNAGLKDQVAALRWVKENIKSFGGDPDNVTVFGESAGGASTAFHALSPMSKGLFKRVIPMSGVPTCDWSQSHQPRKRAFILGKLLGMETNDPKKLLEFLLSVPAEKLISNNPTVFKSEEITNVLKFYHFTPVVEKNFGQEHFLMESPIETVKKGNLNKVDWLIGNTDQEALVVIEHFAEFSTVYNRYPEMVVPRKILIQCTPDVIVEASKSIHKYYFDEKPIGEDCVKDFVEYCNDSCMLYDIGEFADIVPQLGTTKKFLYVFSCVSGRNSYGNKGAKYGLKGASHLDDTLYLFDAKKFNMSIDKSSKEYKLVELVNTVFTNFAKYGTPTPDKSLGVTWPEYESSTKKYVEIGDELKVKDNYKAEERHFWKGVYKNAGVEICYFNKT